MSWRRTELYSLLRDFGGDKPVLPVLQNYPYVKPEGRKSLLLGTRVRSDPTSLPLALHQVQSTYLPIIRTPPEGTIVPRYIPTSRESHDTIYQLSDSDIINSIVSSAIRSMRYERSQNIAQEEKEFRGSFLKELEATQGDDRPQVFDYSCWFRGEHNKPLHSTFPPRPALNQQIASVLDDFRNSFADRIILPRYSRRHMAHSSAASIGFKTLTGAECERYYFETGRHPVGPMEMRQAWKYNDLTPRTYFAQGGSVYVISKYAQEVFNVLIDLFEVSHRRRRFDLSRLEFDDDSDIWIYDYSSFTSNNTEQKYFLDELAIFCDGYPLYVMDSRQGVVRLDLGQYIRDYNQVANKCPEFELGPTLLRRLSLQYQKYVHRKAGALGVFGNLASCTVHHGLVSMNIFGGVKKTSVVGDDGAGVAKKYVPPTELGELPEPLTAPEDIRAAVRLLGDIASRKFAVLGPSQEPYGSQWTYLKRALTRHSDSLELWPQEHIINMAIYFQDRTETLRKGSETIADEITSFLVQVLNLLLRIHRQESTIQDSELRVVCLLLRSSYKNLRLPAKGSLTGAGIVWQKGGQEHALSRRQKFFVNKIIPFIPGPDYCYYLRQDPIRFLVHRHDFSVPLKSPKLVRRSDIPFARITFRAGDIFEDVSRAGYTWLQDLNLISRQPLEVETFEDAESYLEHYGKFKDRRYDELYSYTVLSDVPHALRMYFNQ